MHGGHLPTAAPPVASQSRRDQNRAQRPAPVATGILPAVEGRHLAARMGGAELHGLGSSISDRAVGRLITPGWKPRLHGRQDAGRHRAGYGVEQQAVSTRWEGFAGCGHRGTLREVGVTDGIRTRNSQNHNLGLYH